MTPPYCVCPCPTPNCPRPGTRTPATHKYLPYKPTIGTNPTLQGAKYNIQKALRKAKNSTPMKVTGQKTHEVVVQAQRAIPARKMKTAVRKAQKLPAVRKVRRKVRKVGKDIGRNRGVKAVKRKGRLVIRDVRKAVPRERGRGDIRKGGEDVEKLSKRRVRKWERELLRTVNRERKCAGLPKLRLSRTLCEVARRHNLDQMFILRGISHVGSTGKKVGERLRNAGIDYRYAAENVAAGQRNVSHVHASLMGSRGHRKNILHVEMKEMGMHVGRGRDGRLYWTQVFLQRRV